MGVHGRVHAFVPVAVMQRLPRDVQLEICMWLSVRDILALRRLNRFFHEFTKTSSIWLSLFQRLKLLLPPGQPVTLDPVWHHTMEHYVLRSMRFQQNWRWNYNPLPVYYKFNCPKPVLFMVSLPGGKHMVSIHDNSDTTEETIRNMIVVWDMSFRGKRNPVIIAVIHLGIAVRKLQARYALVGGHISLVIAYVQPPLAGRTTVIVKYAHLALLNEMSRLSPGTPAYDEFMKRSADPFEQLLKNSTRYPVGAISLSEINGMPILAVVHRKRTIVIYNLTSRARSTLKLLPVPDYGDWTHSIWNIKILSSQEHIFVIRTLIDRAVDAIDETPVVLELYNFPPADGSCDDEYDDYDHDFDDDRPHNHPVQSRRVLDFNVDACYISDGEASWDFRTHPDPDVPMLHMLAKSSPPPLSVFLTTKENRGFIHFLMIPEKNPPEDLGYYYDLPLTYHERYDWEAHDAPMIFPGSYHSIVIMRSPPPQPLSGISVLQLCAYRTQTYEFSGPGDTDCHISKRDGPYLVSNSSVTGTEHVENPINRALKHPALPDFLARSMRLGTRSLQFDEWLGRLCIVTSDDPNSIQVLDWSL